jgi:hypothetical protein
MLNERFQQGLFGAEVVIEGSFRDLEIIEHILDRHLFVAFGLHQSSGCIENSAPFHAVFVFFDGACHHSFFLVSKPTDGLLTRKKYTR